MTDTHPTTLREALNYLRKHRSVRLTTQMGGRLCRSWWRYAGIDHGTIWFRPHTGQGNMPTGLSLHGSDLEVGLTFDEAGFHWQRGSTFVRVTYNAEPEEG